MTLSRYTFEIVPTDWDGSSLEGIAFKPTLMDVPVFDLSAEEHARAARRAWWQAFHILGPQGVEPEDFQVFEWDQWPGRGREVGSGGFVTQ